MRPERSFRGCFRIYARIGCIRLRPSDAKHVALQGGVISGPMSDRWVTWWWRAPAVLPFAVVIFIVDPWLMGMPLWSIPHAGGVMGTLAGGVAAWFLIALGPVGLGAGLGPGVVRSFAWWRGTVRAWLWIGTCSFVPVAQLWLLLGEVDPSAPSANIALWAAGGSAILLMIDLIAMKAEWL